MKTITRKIKPGTAYLWDDGEFMICISIMENSILWERNFGHFNFCITPKAKEIECYETMEVES